MDSSAHILQEFHPVLHRGTHNNWQICTWSREHHTESVSVWVSQGCSAEESPRACPAFWKGGAGLRRKKSSWGRNELLENLHWTDQARFSSYICSLLPLIFIGLCWSEINAESPARCKSWRLLHKQDSAEQNEYFSSDILCPFKQDHTNTVELILSQILSELLMGQTKAQALSGTQAGLWIGSTCLEKCRVRETLKSPQTGKRGLLPILRPEILLYFPTILHYEKFSHEESRSILGNPEKKVRADLVPELLSAFIGSVCPSHASMSQFPFTGICCKLSQVRSQIATGIQILELSKCSLLEKHTSAIPTPKCDTSSSERNIICEIPLWL